MKKIYFLLLLTGCFVVHSHAQIFDSSIRAKGLLLPKATDLLNTSFAVFPDKAPGTPRDRTVHLEFDFPPVGSQGQIASCASWAVAYGAMSSLYKKTGGYSYYSAGNQLDESKVFSPLFLYNSVRVKQTVRLCDDAGSFLDENLQFMVDNGVCRKNSFDPRPYRYPQCDVDPLLNKNAVAEAQSYKIKNYAMIFFEEDGIKRYSTGYKTAKIIESLEMGYPVIIGGEIDNAFFNKGGTSYNNTIIWDTWDNFNGHHAMVIVGYDDKLKAFKLFNSWGTGWGNKGFGWITASMLEAHIWEGYIINPENIRLIRSARLLAGVKSELDKQSSEPSFQENNPFFRENNIVAKNRYQPYNDIRITPVEFNRANGSVVFEVYKTDFAQNDFITVDIFSVGLKEVHVFTHGGFTYEFRLTRLSRDLLFRNIAHYIIKTDRVSTR